MNKLWQARLQAFLIQAGSLILVAITGVFLSEDFRTLVTQHFGDTFVTSSALLLLTGFLSHIRNRLALRKLGRADRHDDSVVLI